MTALPGPVAIGGVGGSGTRVVAQILLGLGFYLGNDLNKPIDNLWFTLLFKRPQWFTQADREDILENLRLFEQAMTGHLPLTRHTLHLIWQPVIELLSGTHGQVRRTGPLALIWAPTRVISLLNANRVNLPHYQSWGWKEPNTHIYLEYLYQHFPHMKYIHVVRHGLDMAYSQNQQQLYNWATHYNLPIPNTKHPTPQAALTYWVKSNQTAIKQGQDLLGERFLYLNFDRLCMDQQEEIDKLLNFLDLSSTDAATRQRLYALPKLPASAGRYKRQNLAIFSPEDIDVVRQLGFDVA